MLDDLRELYQEVILDHGKRPRNFRHPDDANRHAHGNNPLCGDRLTVFLKIDDKGVIQDAAFEGRGCAISTASASMMTEAVKGKPVAEVEKLFHSFHNLVTGRDGEGDEEPAELGKLEALSGVREIPIRVKCATLAWHTLHAALADAAKRVSTE
jgi:nitrogen fixation protein NifU and related proteins